MEQIVPFIRGNQKSQDIRGGVGYFFTKKWYVLMMVNVSERLNSNLKEACKILIIPPLEYIRALLQLQFIDKRGILVMNIKI